MWDFEGHMLKVNGYKLLALTEHMFCMTVLYATAFLMVGTASTQGSEAFTRLPNLGQ
jgi:hypothetical protein